MNQNSSRGHAILQLQLQQWKSEDRAEVLCTKLNFVDLAGSERNPEVQNKKSATEAHSINVSLSALAGVVAALTSCNRHVPYRDSKLTYLLKDSLGGNCNTFLLATISPVARSFHESVSTLKFADTASNVVNRVVRNKRPDVASLLERKDREINRLTGMLAAFNRAQSEQARDTSSPQQLELAKQSKQLQAQIAQLKVQAACVCRSVLLEGRDKFTKHLSRPQPLFS
jgi:hypothetical protein